MKGGTHEDILVFFWGGFQLFAFFAYQYELPETNIRMYMHVLIKFAGSGHSFWLKQFKRLIVLVFSFLVLVAHHASWNKRSVIRKMKKILIIEGMITLNVEVSDFKFQPNICPIKLYRAWREGTYLKRYTKLLSGYLIQKRCKEFEKHTSHKNN